MRQLSLSMLAVLVLGCSTGVSTSEHDIIGGTRSTGIAATVLLASFPPNRSVLDTCTAVVVSPTVLLTAAHCVDAADHPSYLYGVFTGDDASAYPTLAALEPHLVMAAAVHPHPQYSTQLPFFADLGVVEMPAPLAITPLPIQRAPLDATIIGKQAQIVGYGQTVYQQANSARYEAMTTVGAIDGDTIVVGDTVHHACLGDSGGPAIVDGTVVGIDSYGPTGCGSASHYRRVDAFLPFIDLYVPPPVGTDAGVQPGTDAAVPPGGDAGLDGKAGGGCSAGGSGGPAIALAMLAALRRRRRSCS